MKVSVSGVRRATSPNSLSFPPVLPLIKIVFKPFNFATLNAYYHVLNQILTDYWIPYKFLTDRRTIFVYVSKNASSDEEDTFTQFSYACSQLGIEITTTSVPQAKGRVERLNRTLQSRSPVDLKQKGVQSIEQANRQLPQIIKSYNDKFGLPIHGSKTVFEKQPSHKEINLILSVLTRRIINSGHCIRVNKKYYIPVSSSGMKVYYTSKTHALIIQSLDGQLFVNINDTVYGLEEIKTREEFSKDFDDVPDIPRQ